MLLDVHAICSSTFKKSVRSRELLIVKIDDLAVMLMLWFGEKLWIHFSHQFWQINCFCLLRHVTVVLLQALLMQNKLLLALFWLNY